MRRRGGRIRPSLIRSPYPVTGQVLKAAGGAAYADAGEFAAAAKDRRYTLFCGTQVVVVVVVGG
jgi:hypothetical protein